VCIYVLSLLYCFNTKTQKNYTMTTKTNPTGEKKKATYDPTNPKVMAFDKEMKAKLHFAVINKYRENGMAVSQRMENNQDYALTKGRKLESWGELRSEIIAGMKKKTNEDKTSKQ